MQYNFRNGWRGHLWHERFHSFVMDESYLLSTVRYVELNPVEAKLCKQPADRQWSSALPHLLGKGDSSTVVNMPQNKGADVIAPAGPAI
nr:hypothetical protein [Thiohalomonas denitrificans]